MVTLVSFFPKIFRFPLGYAFSKLCDKSMYIFKFYISATFRYFCNLWRKCFNSCWTWLQKAFEKSSAPILRWVTIWKSFAEAKNCLNCLISPHLLSFKPTRGVRVLSAAATWHKEDGAISGGSAQTWTQEVGHKPRPHHHSERKHFSKWQTLRRADLSRSSSATFFKRFSLDFRIHLFWFTSLCSVF